jgi:hypothetical protein
MNSGESTERLSSLDNARFKSRRQFRLLTAASFRPFLRLCGARELEVRQLGALRMARSANLDFFAAKADQRAVLDFLFSATDVRVFESYSEPDAELREFPSTDDLAAAFPLGSDPHGNGHAIGLQLWSPSVMRDLSISRFKLDPTRCNGHTFRHNIEGGGLMQLYFGGICDRVVTMSHFGHQSQVRAKAWGVDDGVNWVALKTLSNRIQYHIRKRLGVGKAGSLTVLAEAMSLARVGFALKSATRTPWAYELRPEIESKD